MGVDVAVSSWTGCGTASSGTSYLRSKVLRGHTDVGSSVYKWSPVLQVVCRQFTSVVVIHATCQVSIVVDLKHAIAVVELSITVNMADVM